jgi:hypothetical protein
LERIKWVREEGIKVEKGFTSQSGWIWPFTKGKNECHSKKEKSLSAWFSGRPSSYFHCGSCCPSLGSFCLPPLHPASPWAAEVLSRRPLTQGSSWGDSGWDKSRDTSVVLCFHVGHRSAMTLKLHSLDPQLFHTPLHRNSTAPVAITVLANVPHHQ